jgi:hypothetical protein
LAPGVNVMDHYFRRFSPNLGEQFFFAKTSSVWRKERNFAANFLAKSF